MTDCIQNEIPPTKAKVLIVDDDELIRESLTQILESEDFGVATAASVNDALKLIASQVFDVLLSDLHIEQGQVHQSGSRWFSCSQPDDAAGSERRPRRMAGALAGDSRDRGERQARMRGRSNFAVV